MNRPLNLPDNIVINNNVMSSRFLGHDIRIEIERE